MRGAGLAKGLALGLAAAALAACTTAPAPPPPSTGESGTGLRPLARQLVLPPGAPPRSQVPSVLYDLSVSGTGEEDGVPGDAGPREIFERGGASWYGIQFHQRKTANGERFDMAEMTAAHKTLPFNTRVCVRSLVNGREVLVRINDRGPYSAGRIIDLSRAAADALGMLGLGIKQVALSIVDKNTTRCGDTAIDPAAIDGTPPQVAVAAKPARNSAPRRTREVPPRLRR